MPISESTDRTGALKARTKDFAIRIFRLVDALPKSLLPVTKLKPLLREADEIVSIMAASRKSAVANRQSAIQ